MENDFFNTPKINYCVDGKVWLSTRHIKDIDNKEIYTIPKNSYIANNVLYGLRCMFQFIKVLLGSGIIGLIISKLF